MHGNMFSTASASQLAVAAGPDLGWLMLNRISRQKLLRRLRREIDTLRALDGCPSSIAFETEGHVYLIMEVCHGGDLETLLKVRCSPFLES
jgi:serine/threonine protein kinase